MKFQTMQRILCCFLAMLILCFAVVKPLEAQAAAVGAAASIVGLTVESAIPLLLSTLSVSYLAASISELGPKIKAAVKNWIFTKNGTDYINAYRYNDSYCFSSDVLAKVTTVSDTFLKDKYNSNGYANMVALDWHDSSNVSYSYICFSNNSPKTAYSEGAQTVALSCQLPAIFFIKKGNQWTFYDESKTTDSGFRVEFPCVAAPTVSDQKGSPTFKYVAITNSNTAVDIPAGAPTDTGKDKVYPVIDTSKVTTGEVYETGTTVSASTATKEETDTSTSDTSISSILDWLRLIYNAIISLSGLITDPITTAVNVAVNSVIEYLSDGKVKLNSIANHISELCDAVITDIKTAVVSIPETLANIWSSIQTLAESISVPIVNAVTDVIEWLISIGASLSDILEWLLSLPGVLVQSIIDALSAVFVPSEGYLDTKVMELRASFPLFDSVLTSAKTLRSLFSFGSTPPIIYIDLGASTSWNIGSKVVFIDMTWYAKYKPTVDIILSVFLWLFFLWRVFLSLPGIISGTPGIWGRGSVEPTKTSDSTDIMIIR